MTVVQAAPAAWADAGPRQAFRLAAGELGIASAAWLFVEQTAQDQGESGVAALRDQLGREWSVLDAACAGWLRGARRESLQPATAQVAARLQGATRLLLVGHEADAVDALLPLLPHSVRVGLLCHGDPHISWPRVLANHGGRVHALGLDDFQSWAGPRSALLTFVYGQPGVQAFVQPLWLRVGGADVRLQFAQLLGWRVMPLPLEVYPRWLVAAEADSLTELLPER